MEGQGREFREPGFWDFGNHSHDSNDSNNSNDGKSISSRVESFASRHLVVSLRSSSALVNCAVLLRILPGWILPRARICWRLSAQFLCGFVVSASLRDTRWSIYGGQMTVSAKLPQYLCGYISKSSMIYYVLIL